MKIKIDDGYWEKEYNKETLLNKIESDFKESEKLNKMLIFKRNELKRNIKNINSRRI